MTIATAIAHAVLKSACDSNWTEIFRADAILARRDNT
jgi:hypothetical protein